MDNLTKDVLAAEKAGMHYGDWKALHPHTRDDDIYIIADQRSKDDGVKYAVCPSCKKIFTPTRQFIVVCSEECRKIRALERKRYHARMMRGTA